MSDLGYLAIALGVTAFCSLLAHLTRPRPTQIRRRDYAELPSRLKAGGRGTR